MRTPTAATWNKIVVAARNLCDTFCWIRTTPCDEAVHNTRGMGMHRFAADCRAYNAIADSVMHRRGVPAVDLYAFTRALGPELYADHVHIHPHIQARQAAFIASWLCGRHNSGEQASARRRR